MGIELGVEGGSKPTPHSPKSNVNRYLFRISILFNNKQ